MDLPQTLINRKGYSERIKPFMRKSIAKVLTGQRRVGKSFLLFQLMKQVLEEEPNANIIYINFEEYLLWHICQTGIIPKIQLTALILIFKHPCWNTRNNGLGFYIMNNNSTCPNQAIFS